MKLAMTMIAMLALLLLAGCGSDCQKTLTTPPVGGSGSTDAPAPPVGLNLPAVPPSPGQNQGQHS